MIVPIHWAEARKQHKVSGRQITVRRYGWSDTSDAEARVDEALRRILAGEPLARREPLVSYNGADGVPIREEILSRHGAQVITRNSYGAHCLNSPDALFADIDFESEQSAMHTLLAFASLAITAVISGWVLQSWLATLGILFVSLLVASPLASLPICSSLSTRL